MVPTHDMIKNPEQIVGIRESGRINTLVLDYVAEHIREGMTHGGNRPAGGYEDQRAWRHSGAVGV